MTMTTAKPWTPTRIKRLRQRLGMTQTEFARAVGVASLCSVSRWEQGVNGPDARSRRALDELEAQTG